MKAVPPATPISSGCSNGPQNPRSSLIQIITDKISPVSDEARKKIIQRKRRSEKREILTGSPFKDMLGEKVKISQEKIKKAAERREKNCN